MRFSVVDLMCLDIIWFGADINGNILAFNSGGHGNVPEYVCRSQEETEFLERFFLEKLGLSTKPLLETDDDGSPLVDDAKGLAGRGVFVYDVCFEGAHDEEYERIARPAVPIHVSSLPDDVVVILKDHKVEADALRAKYIAVKHAY